MGLPTPPMDEFGPRVPMCRTCLLEIDQDGYCSCCGRLDTAAVVIEEINGGRGESVSHATPAAEGA